MLRRLRWFLADLRRLVEMLRDPDPFSWEEDEADPGPIGTVRRGY